MAPGPLSARVAVLCAEIGPRLDGHTRAAVADLQQRLGEPLRVAIAGRLKAGKSTLVNALIGRRVAPTQVGECTRLVTQFRYGTSDRVDVVHTDGSRSALPLDPSGEIPQRIGVPRDQVAYIDVTLSSDRLRAVTVVDTPGLSSTNDSISKGSKDFLLGNSEPEDNSPLAGDLDSESEGALTGAEAIIYVFTQAVRQDDVVSLDAFRSMSARLSSNPINSLGLLNKVDKFGNGGDPWPVAKPLAHGQAEILRRQVSGVVPVCGLLAETTETGRLTAADCETLRTLAKMPGVDKQILTASVDLFVNRECEIPRADRERLLELLDLYGVKHCVAAFEADENLATGEIIRQLYQASGFGQVRDVLDATFNYRADGIKAGWGLSALEAIASRAARPADRDLLRSATERLLQEPQYHQLRLLEVAQQVTTGQVELPSAMEGEVTRLALSDDPGYILAMPSANAETLAHAALDAATRWRTFAVAGANPKQARVAQVAHRGFHLLSQRIRAAAGQPPVSAPPISAAPMQGGYPPAPQGPPPGWQRGPAGPPPFPVRPVNQPRHPGGAPYPPPGWPPPSRGPQPPPGGVGPYRYPPGPGPAGAPPWRPR